MYWFSGCYWFEAGIDLDTVKKHLHIYASALRLRSKGRRVSSLEESKMLELCISKFYLPSSGGNQPRRRFDTVLSQQMDCNEIVMWGSTEANRSHASSRVGQAWGHPRPLAALPASRTSLLSLVGVLVDWSVQLRADSVLCLLTQSQFWTVNSLAVPVTSPNSLSFTARSYRVR